MSLYRRTPRGNTLLLLSAVLIALGIVGALETQAFLLYAGVGLFLFYYATKLLLQLKVKASTSWISPGGSLRESARGRRSRST